jgi:hypothetical protein
LAARLREVNRREVNRRWTIACLAAAAGCASHVAVVPTAIPDQSHVGYHAGATGLRVRVTNPVTALPMFLVTVVADYVRSEPTDRSDFTDKDGQAFFAMSPGVHRVDLTYGGALLSRQVLILAGTTELDVVMPIPPPSGYIVYECLAPEKPSPKARFTTSFAPGPTGVAVHAVDATTGVPLMARISSDETDEPEYTEEDGRAFLALSPGEHQIDTRYKIADLARDVAVRAGQTSMLEVALDPRCVPATERTPIVDAGSAKQGIDRDQGKDLLRLKWEPWALR